MTPNQKQIMDELALIRQDIKEIRQIDIPALQVGVGKLEVKAGIWGSITGLVAGLFSSFVGGQS